MLPSLDTMAVHSDTPHQGHSDQKPVAEIRGERVDNKGRSAVPCRHGYYEKNEAYCLINSYLVHGRRSYASNERSSTGGCE